MAADLIMPTLPGDSQTSRHFLAQSRPPHSRAQSYNVPAGPQISPLSTSNTSASSQTASTPPSPKTYYMRQGRPMYIPAVLRPCDEFPSWKMARCKTAGSSSDSDSDAGLRRVNSNLKTMVSLGVLSQRLGRRHAPDNMPVLHGDWDLDSFPPPTSLPTRRHWKPDSESFVCDDATCKRSFSYFVRRHHCRKCGNIFCNWHSSFVLPLDQDAQFNPRAALSRACNHCFQEIKAIYARDDAHSLQSVSSDANLATPSAPVAAPSATPNVSTCQAGDAAASVPRDWNWSTF
ncbi:hypothetical protein CDD82_3831 [Ophiocordyceps australis]|uniref:FYVE-type domain-containing protein n=1 Tax=Ophiocordyceps australis TaxID=1399860 RepID=A0A2C5Y578_9HYPO|nr:hypothetical protein CDD82_3831 [Ophiocordyceps australis]